MNKRIMFVILILAAILLAACSPKMESAEAPAADLRSSGVTAPGAMPLAPQDKAMEESYQSGSGDLSSVANATGTIERIVLKNADLSIVVPDPAVSMNNIIKMAERMGGFVVNSSLSRYTTDTGVVVPVAYITIRVPSDLLTEAMDEIKGQTEKPDTDILSENISGQDVTAEYTDLQSRLKNLELSEKKLQEFLDGTTKAEDWLVAFNRLSEIRSQIEVLKGQIRYYDESAAMSAISINLQAQEAVKPITVGKWEPKGVALQAIQRLIKTMRKIYEGLLKFVLYTLPVLLVYLILIGGPIVFFIWLIRRIMKHYKKPAPPAAKK